MSSLLSVGKATPAKGGQAPPHPADGPEFKAKVAGEGLLVLFTQEPPPPPLPSWALLLCLAVRCQSPVLPAPPLWFFSLNRKVGSHPTHPHICPSHNFSPSQEELSGLGWGPGWARGRFNLCAAKDATSS